jgi:hypothetical protein
MKLLCVFSSLLAVASAFSTQRPHAFVTKISTPVGDGQVAEQSHRTRRATIVMDGKANGTYVHFVPPVFDFFPPEWQRTRIRTTTKRRSIIFKTSVLDLRGVKKIV